MAGSEQRVAYRTIQQSRALLIGLAVYTLLWGVGMVQVAASDDASMERRVIGLALIAAHLLLVAWFVGYRCARAGVLAGPSDVIVRNPTRSYRVGWDEIESFSVEPAGLWTQAYLHMKDGSSIPIYGIQGQQPRLFPRSTWAVKPVQELNRLLRDKAGSKAAKAQNP